jgi:DNA-binding transcriptional ArsR family regulator
VHLRDINDPRLVKALAHPVRIQILRSLQGRVASPREISEEISVRLPNVSYHTRVLQRIGVIELVKTRQRRGAVEHYYRAKGTLRITDRVWDQVPEIVKSAMAGAAIDQAVRSITSAASLDGFSRKEAVVTRLVMDLDEQGFRDLSAAAGALIERAAEIENECARRRASDHDAPSLPTGLVTMMFEAASVEERQPDEHPRPARQATRAARR